MNTITQFIRLVSLVVVVLYTHTSWAQHSNPILLGSPDIRSAAMGETLGLSSSAMMPLYHSPSTMLASSFLSGYSLGLTTHRAQGGRQYFHTLSAGYRLSPSQALLVGARYWGGLQMDYYSTTGTKVGQIHPRDWTLDLGYAYALTSPLSLYAGASYLQTYSSQTAHGWMLHLGATYRSTFPWLRDGAYALDLSVRNLGPKLTYTASKSSTTDLPTYVQAASMLSFAPMSGQRLTFEGYMRYQMALNQDQAFSAGVGLEYDLASILALRLGAVYQLDNSYFTLGVGHDFGGLSLGAAYRLGSYSEFNLLRVGLTLSI